MRLNIYRETLMNETTNQINNQTEKRQSDKRRRRVNRKILRRTVIAAVLLSAAVFGVSMASPMLPHAISINGEQVCYVDSRAAAEEVVAEVINDFLPEGSAIKAVSTDDRIRVERADSFFEARDNTKSVREAAQIVKTSLESGEIGTADAVTKSTDGDLRTSNISGVLSLLAYAADSITDEDDTLAAEEAANDTTEPAAITIVSTGEDTVKLKYKTEYVQDDSMFAGESVVDQEGKKGKAWVMNRYTSVNGEIVETEELERKVLKEPVNKIIRKGTLGLPEGEDWKTYDGDPVYNDGEDLTKTALKYLGVPYKYGGKSLVTGVDCVQFIRLIYAKYGVHLPGGKYGLQHAGISVSYSNAKPGDIICYSGHHYAIYLGNGRIVHATSKGGVKTRDNAKFRKIVTVRRIVN